MALHINAQNDLNEMFDKFATMPLDKANKPQVDVKKKEDAPTAKADTEQKTAN